MKMHELQMINNYIYMRNVINEDEFKKFFFELFPNRNERYYNYYLLDMYRHNVLYKYGTKKLKPCGYRRAFNFHLEIDPELKHRIEKISPGIIVSLWNTTAFSHLTSLQMISNIAIVETYSYAKDFVLNLLLEEGKLAIYEEDYLIMSKYSKNVQLYIVRTLNEECPIIKRDFSYVGRISRRNELLTFVTVPKIEKILVDFLVDEIYKILFSDEINNIFYQILKYYQINMSTVLRYAKKRHSERKILDYLDYIGFDVESGEFR